MILLEEAADSFAAVIKEVASDGDQCFQCRSAAVGALLTNIQIHNLTPEDIMNPKNKLSVTALRRRARTSNIQK